MHIGDKDTQFNGHTRRTSQTLLRPRCDAYVTATDLEMTVLLNPTAIIRLQLIKYDDDKQQWWVLGRQTQRGCKRTGRLLILMMVNTKQ